MNELQLLKSNLESDLRVAKRQLKRYKREFDSYTTDWLRGYTKGLITGLESEISVIETNLNLLKEVR